MQSKKKEKQSRNVPVANRVAAPKPKKEKVVMAPLSRDVRRSTYLRILPAKRFGRYEGAIRIQGCDLVMPVTTPVSGDPTPDGPGKTLCEFYVNPSEFSGTRLAKFAQLYEKYLFTHMKFIFVPCLPATQAGSIGLAYDRDINDPTPPPSPAGLRQFCAWPGTAVGRVWDTFEVKGELLSPELGFYSDANGREDRTSYQGQLYAFTEVPVTGLAAGTVIGYVMIEYEIELFVPSLDVLTPVSSWKNDGTTSAVQADILRPFCAGVPGTSADPLNAVTVYQPFGYNGAGIGQMVIPEGVHRLIIQYVQNAAGSINLATAGGPTMTPIDPAPAGAPQPQFFTVANAPSAAAGANALVDYLLNVPKGGVQLNAVATTLTGGTTTGNMNINKLSGWMDPPTFERFANAFRV